MANKATSKAVSTAAQHVWRGKAPFPVGGKKLYLPNHIVKFLRPKPGQSSTTATFEVPLTFNKLDFRDYLYHLYNVKTTSVRSFINQKMPAQRTIPGKFGGQWYRPRSQKLMMVDLVKPFVWPERPAEEDMAEWDHKLYEAVEKGHSKEVAKAEAQGSWGPQTLRINEPRTRERTQLRKEAAQLMTGKKKWSPGPRGYVEVETDETDETIDATPEEQHEALAAATAAAEAEAATAEKAEGIEAKVAAVSQSARESAKQPVTENIKHGKRL